MNKFNAKATFIDGKRFDSQKEARRYKELRLLERGGLIKDLLTQVRFELTPKQMDSTGKTILTASYYIADFVYTDSTGKTVVEDVKGFRTPLYIQKKKDFYQRYKILIQET